MQSIPDISPHLLRNGAHRLHGEHIIRLGERDDHMEEELLSSRRVADFPDDQSLGLAVVGGLLLRLGGQFALARGGDERCVEGHVELVAAQLGREVGGELDHDVHLILGRVLHDGLHQYRREERVRRTVVHRSERPVGACEMQHVVLLEAGNVHRGMEVHIVHAESAGLVVAGATHNDVVVQTHVEARMAFQSVPHLNCTLERAVGDLRLQEKGCRGSTRESSTQCTFSITSMYRSPVDFILSTIVFIPRSWPTSVDSLFYASFDSFKRCHELNGVVL